MCRGSLFVLRGWAVPCGCQVAKPHPPITHLQGANGMKKVSLRSHCKSALQTLSLPCFLSSNAAGCASTDGTVALPPPPRKTLA